MTHPHYIDRVCPTCGALPCDQVTTPTEADTSLQKVQTTPPDMETVAWRYPVLTARDEAVARMARAMRNGKAWPAVFQVNTAEALAEDALAALEALAVIPTHGGEE